MTNLPPILPAGTRIVANITVADADGGLPNPAGSVGVVVRPPSTLISRSYRVRFANGLEATLEREHFRVQRHAQQEEGVGESPIAGDNLEQHVIYRCVVGSKAFGLDTESSDEDRRGIYLPPADLHWSLWGVPEQIVFEDREACYWEYQKFVSLALKANPNVLECLYTPLVEVAAPPAPALLAKRNVFLSKLVYQTYNAYVLSQFKKMQKDIENHGKVREKHAMHLIRLLHSGIAILRDGFVAVRVEGEVRERLLAIKRGDMPWSDAETWRMDLHREFDRAFESTKLPDHPDVEEANRLLVEARRSML